MEDRMRTKKRITASGRSKLFTITFTMLFLLLSGCIRHYTKAGGIEANYHPLENKSYEVLGRGTAESSSFRLFWFLPVTKALTFSEAMKQAINSKGGDNLVDIRWWFERQYWLVGTVDILYVEGNVIRYNEEEEE